MCLLSQSIYTVCTTHNTAETQWSKRQKYMPTELAPTILPSVESSHHTTTITQSDTVEVIIPLLLENAEHCGASVSEGMPLK